MAELRPTWRTILGSPHLPGGHEIENLPAGGAQAADDEAMSDRRPACPKHPGVRMTTLRPLDGWPGKLRFVCEVDSDKALDERCTEFVDMDVPPSQYSLYANPGGTYLPWLNDPPDELGATQSQHRWVTGRSRPHR